MAGWQCDFSIVPKESVKNGEAIDFEDVPTWKKERISVKALHSLEKYLPIEKSWSKNITQYGNLESTCVEILSLPNNEAEINVRLDLPKLTSDIYKALLRFIQESDCVIYMALTDKTYSGDETALKQVMQESIAFRLGWKYNSFFRSLYSQ